MYGRHIQQSMDQPGMVAIPSRGQLNRKNYWYVVGMCDTNSMYGRHIQQSMDQPGMVAIPSRGQLNRKNEFFPVPVRA